MADAAVKLGADKVIVNNGGDIALRLGSAESAVVGIKPQGADKLIGRLHLNHEHGIGGIASSGWGGRSHSTGVADLVTVWAQNAGRADAAATLIAGRTVALGENVKRTRCCELDPLSDLGNMPVTEKVGRLTSAQRRQALDQGAVIAEKMYLQGLIRGCLLCVQGDTILLDPDVIMTQVQLCKSSVRK